MPPQIKVVEIMTCGFTAPAILDFLVQKCKETTLQPFLVQKESMGFIYNRLWAAIKRETLMMLSEGVADAGVVDEIFKSVLGTRYGPCFMMDCKSLGENSQKIRSNRFTQMSDLILLPISRDTTSGNEGYLTSTLSNF